MYRAVQNGSVPFPVHRIGGYWYVPTAVLQRFLNGEQVGAVAETAQPSRESGSG